MRLAEFFREEQRHTIRNVLWATSCKNMRSKIHMASVSYRDRCGTHARSWVLRQSKTWDYLVAAASHSLRRRLLNWESTELTDYRCVKREEWRPWDIVHTEIQAVKPTDAEEDGLYALWLSQQPKLFDGPRPTVGALRVNRRFIYGDKRRHMDIINRNFTNTFQAEWEMGMLCL